MASKVQFLQELILGLFNNEEDRSKARVALAELVKTVQKNSQE